MKHSLIFKLIFILTTLLRSKLFRELRNNLWRFCGVIIGERVNIMPGVEFINGDDIIIGNGTFIGEGVKITGGTIIIGENCDIAPWSIIHAGTHRIGPNKRRAGTSYYGKIIIGNGSWIGTGCCLIDGAKIGEGCIVAAGTTVYKQFSDNLLIASNNCNAKKNID